MSENGGQAQGGDPVGAGSVVWEAGELRTVWTPDVSELAGDDWEFVAVLEPGYEGWCLMRYRGEGGGEDGLVSNEALWEANKLLVSEMADQAVTIRELRGQVGEWRARWLQEHNGRLDDAGAVQAAATLYGQFETLRAQLAAAEDAADEAEARAAWAWDLLRDVQGVLALAEMPGGEPAWAVTFPAALADFIADGISKNATYEAETGRALTLYERHRMYRLAYDLLLGDGHATQDELVAALWGPGAADEDGEDRLHLAEMAAYENGEEDLFRAWRLLGLVRDAIYEGEHVPGGVEVVLRGDVVADLKHGAGGDRVTAVQAAIEAVVATFTDGETTATGAVLVEISSAVEDLVLAGIETARGVLWAATGESVFAAVAE